MKKGLLAGLIILLVLLLAGGIYLVNRTEEVPETAGQQVHVSPTPTPVKKTGAQNTAAPDSAGLSRMYNILLVGVDNQDKNNMEVRGNADGIIIATINPETRELIFTSFMRDTRVRVRDSTYDKLTNVYHTGGIELLSETLEQNFEVPIDYYAIFNYVDIADIVDAIGGVEVELTSTEIMFMESKIASVSWLTGSDYKENVIDPDQVGPTTLNGVQAAAYARIRPSEGGYDAGRTERGQEIITAIMSKALQLGTSDMLQFASVFYEKIETDVPDDVFLELGLNASELRRYTKISDRIPLDGAYESSSTGSGYYAIPDFEVNNKHLHDSIYNGIHN